MPPVTDEIHGNCDPGFEGIETAFRRCFTELGETGAAVCVYHDGRPVADLWGGVADPVSRRPWASDTLVNVYSVTKPFAAICLLHLIDDGQVDLDAPVADYWPEFAQAGKADIPVRWLLTHQAGLLGIREKLPRQAIFGWDRITSLLAAEEPWWPPGQRHGEHAVFFGHLVGEIVRRVSGISVGRHLRDRIAEPWGLDFHIGLEGGAEPRCAQVVGMDDGWRTGLGMTPGSLYERALGNPPGLVDADMINSSAWRQAEVPAINGHGTAHGVARFYGGLSLGGELDGARLLSKGLLREACSIQSEGEDVLLRHRVGWGLGFQVETDGFGLGGLGGALGWGNLEHRLGFGYVTNRMATHDRAMSVFRALAGILGFEVADGA